MNCFHSRGLLFAAALLASTTSVQVANASPDVRVGIVDMQKALERSKSGMQAQKQLEQDLKRAQTEIDAKKGDLERRQQAFSKQKSSLNPDALRSKQEELISMEKDLKRSFQDQQDQLRRRNASVVSDLVKRIRRVVDAIGKEKGYTVILEKGSQFVLFADGESDVTDEVIRRFDAASE